MATYTTRNGRTTATVRKVGFKHQTQTFASKRLAERWALGVEADMSRGIAVDMQAQRQTTVKALFERFRDEECPERKGGRWETVRINMFLANADWVHRRLDQDLPHALRTWVKERVTQVSGASVNREMNLISGVFAKAIKGWGVPLQVNPVHLVERPAKNTRGRDRTWSPADLEKFKAALGEVNTPPRFLKDYLGQMVELAIESAMRLGELCSIRKAECHLDQAWLRLVDTKNGDQRDVPLSQRAVEILRPLVDVADDLVFPVNSGSLGVRFREVRAAAGLPDLRFHDTRHTAATQLSKKFSNVLELSAITGHRSLQSLKGYYNPDASELAKRMG